MSTPLISVVMSVYNGMPYLPAAVESVLNQTCPDFEFIIIDDCSTDDTCTYLSSLNDSRIRLLHNEKNLKLPASLNLGISAARGRYIIRMDADDISLPERFKKQAAYMDAHPEAAMAYCDLLQFSDRNIRFDFNTNSHRPEDIQAALLFYNIVNHNGVIFRTSVISNYSYNPEYTVTEDLELWLRLSRKHRIHYMPEPLVLYRVHAAQATTAQKSLQNLQEMQMKQPLLTELLNDCSPKKLRLHQAVSSKRNSVSCKATLSWLHYLRQKNHKSRLYSRHSLDKTLLRMFLTNAVCNHYEKKDCLHGILSFSPWTVFSLAGDIIYNGASDMFWFFKSVKNARKELR